MMTCFQFILRACSSVLLLAAPLVVEAQTITDAINTRGYSWYGHTNEQITLIGSGFIGVTNVAFNGVKASYSLLSDGQINTWVPANATSGLISVTRLGVTAYTPRIFLVVPNGPYITSFDPVGGTHLDTIYIQGANFTGVSGTNDVWFNGAKASSVYVPSDTMIEAHPPAGVITGPITVRIISGANAGTNNTITNFHGPPVITGFSPASGRAGTNVIVSGTNLTGASLLLFNGLPSVFTVNNNNQITATVPPGATTGTLIVSTPGGTYPTSSNFIVLPTITSFSPTFGAAGTNVTLYGANFNVGTPVVTFNGITSAVPTSVTFNSLVAVVPAKATTGPIRVITTNGTATSAALFYLPPRITGFSPTNSAPGTTVTVTGTNFTGTSSVMFNGLGAGFLNVSSNSLQAIVPEGVITGPISITTPGGMASTPGTNFYGAPVITGFSPSHGLPGTNVTLTGQNFLGATRVGFSGADGTSLVVLGNESVRITVPSSAVTGPVSLTAPAGSATTTSNFFLDYAPGLTIRPLAAPRIQLSWPLTYYTYALQSKTNLATNAAWVNVTAPVLPVGGSNVVTDTNVGAAKFYRLKR